MQVINAIKFILRFVFTKYWRYIQNKHMMALVFEQNHRLNFKKI